MPVIAIGPRPDPVAREAVLRGGGTAVAAGVEGFAGNVARFAAGEPLEGLIDPETGY